jgi:hypothetical protein
VVEPEHREEKPDAIGHAHEPKDLGQWRLLVAAIVDVLVEVQDCAVPASWRKIAHVEQSAKEGTTRGGRLCGQPDTLATLGTSLNNDMYHNAANSLLQKNRAYHVW